MDAYQEPYEGGLRSAIGVRQVCPRNQPGQNVAAPDNLSFSVEELAEIDRHVTVDGSVDLWRQAREGAL
jgi:hypothetical protein